MSAVSVEPLVVIVGAGPAGIATAACLKRHSISSIILEKEYCCASLWKNRAYDRLKLHLAKKFCSLPHFPIPSSAPTFVPREGFIQYMDCYVTEFKLEPFFGRFVKSATYDSSLGKWLIEAKNTTLNKTETYTGDFLVVASGENSKGIIPELPGLDSFPGETIHSSEYKSGTNFQDRKVLVVGSGNSGMEISYDLSKYGVDTSIVVRSPCHILSKEMVYVGMTLMKFLPMSLVDHLIMMYAKFRYGDLTQYGLHLPEQGPFYRKFVTGKSPVIDVGTVEKIKKGEIKIFPAITSIKDGKATFEKGEEQTFDAMIFATGYKSTTNSWLKDFVYILNGDGMPKMSFPNHWKGENRLYCAGFSSRGLAGIAMDAEAIADDIKTIRNNAIKIINKLF
ncbi:hypothetical protein IFM89_001664 [Coptis chinensis]|uniref:Flavin-containing monooxygenase n=1 Tax=Coptis chinensis TaxID=261450 RepID=A0A835HKF8_9MAGN|nr:hypothetical protein IFM89_001664 [Coptis chinensis]